MWVWSFRKVIVTCLESLHVAHGGGCAGVSVWDMTGVVFLRLGLAAAGWFVAPRMAVSRP